MKYRARWIFPVNAPPIENGVVDITDEVVSALHNRSEPAAVDMGNVAIIPGLVNAHTHLEFSDLAEPLGSGEGFSFWVEKVVFHRRSRTTPSEEIIEKGLSEVLSSGTRSLGEIATGTWPGGMAANEVSLPETQTAGVVVFRELLALQPERVDEQLKIARAHLDLGEVRNSNGGLHITPGLSPHAPYSVHPELFRQLVDLSRERKAPLAMHLAETQAELELLEHGRGELVEMLSRFGVWKENLIPQGTRIRDYLEALATLDRALVIHGNYLKDDDIAFLARHPQISVVYCPRTHAYFGHEEHPWRKLVEANVRVALGTDSRASNPDLNLWNEVLFLRRRFPRVPPQQWLRWATRNGAEAFYGSKTDRGIIAAGASASAVTVPLAKPDATDPYLALFG